MTRTTVTVRATSDLVRLGLVALLGQHPSHVRLAEPGSVADVDVFEAWTALGARRLLTSGAIARAGRAVLLCPRNEPSLVRELVQGGLRGYLSPRLDAAALVDALRRVHCGEVVVAGPRAPGLAPVEPGTPTPAAEAAGLSRREADVLVLVARGLTNLEIATATYLSPNTVKSYLRNAYRKIGASNRVGAVLWATEHGLVARDGVDLLSKHLFTE